MSKKTFQYNSVAYLTAVWVKQHFNFYAKGDRLHLDSYDIEQKILPFINKKRGFDEKKPVSSESVFRKFREMVSLQQFEGFNVHPYRASSGGRIWVIIKNYP